MALSGKALAVGLILWQRSGVARGRTVPFCQKGAGPEGVSESAARLGIRKLQKAGLVAVVARPGRGLEVTILDAPET
jgi:hypothetical protein